MTRTFAQPLPEDATKLVAWNKDTGKVEMSGPAWTWLARTWNALIEIEREHFEGKKPC
jgi:hypothetical protein